MKALIVPLLAALLSTGCVVSQTRSGVSFGFMDPGTTIAEFQSANGKARLRRHLDGGFSLRFPDKLSQYQMGSFDDVRLVTRHEAGGRTAVLFERRRGDCIDYELVTIANDEVGRNDIGSGCNRPLDAGVVDGLLVIREVTDSPARFWIWSAAGLSTGRESRIATPRNESVDRRRSTQAPSRPSSKGVPSPARTSTATPTKSRNSGVPKRTASTPASRSPQTSARPASRATGSRITLPSGSLRTEVVKPVKVVLERGG